MSELEAAGVWVADDRRTLLEPTSVTVATGQVVVVHGDPGHRHSLLALALGGRLVPSGGELRIDTDHEAAGLQAQVALVDVPGVSEPDEVSALTTIVGEELAMARKPARRTHVDHWLTSNGLRAHRDDRVEDLPPGVRTVAMARLASLRPGVQFLVLALPERSGIDPGAWSSEAAALAGAGFGVLATVSTGVARHLEREHPEIRTVPFGNAVFHDPEDDQ
ncbi:ABC-type transport system involved in cytochrome c biogenesis ATPase subunit [Marmoricola sp. URHA0025 HA25]